MNLPRHGQEEIKSYRLISIRPERIDMEGTSMEMDYFDGIPRWSKLQQALIKKHRRASHNIIYANP